MIITFRVPAQMAELLQVEKDRSKLIRRLLRNYYKRLGLWKGDAK